MTKPKPAHLKKVRSYTPAEKDLGMSALLICGGNKRLAARELKRQGMEVPASTLQRWKEDHPERYRELETELMPEIRAQFAEGFQNLARNYMQGQEAATSLLLDRMKKEEVDTRDLTNVVKAFAISGGIASEKAMLWRGEATSIVEHRSVDEDMAALKRMGVVTVEAEDVTEVEPSPPPASIATP